MLLDFKFVLKQSPFCGTHIVKTFVLPQQFVAQLSVHRTELIQAAVAVTLDQNLDAVFGAKTLHLR